MILDFIPEATRAAGLGALMRGAGMLTRYIPIPQPTLLVGPGSSARLGELIAAFGHRRLMIVTGEFTQRRGLMRPMLDALDAGGAAYAVFAEITPDAPIPLIERGIEFYREHDCDALIAFGGGSSMDAAKAIAMAIANPKPLRDLAGYFKGRHSPAAIYAVPTTAGTGSEVTVAAVISDPEQQSKVVIIDPRLVPRLAALDATLMTGLPPAMTAATGIDALTHAVEAFVGHWATPTSDGMALAAVGMIFGHLRTCYRDGANLAAREQMALAATYAGLAFTRANVGYVHAIAHQFGGRYHTAHGLANAIMLPHVLKYSAPVITDRLALLAVAAKAGRKGEPEEVLAAKFLDAVDQLNRDLHIPLKLDALQEADIPALARAACHEAHTGYPVPRYMSQQICEDMIRKVLPKATATATATTTTATTKPPTRKTPARRAKAAASKP